MKKYNQNTTLKSLVIATAALGVIAVPLVQAEEHVVRTPLKTEVVETFVDGYKVPTEYRTYFTEVPTVKEKDVVVRYYKGRAYYVNSNDWKIIRVADLDPTIKLDKDDTVFVQGYVIPETARTRFIDLPNPDKEVSVRYYNNTAYYMNSDYQIVRTVRLTR